MFPDFIDVNNDHDDDISKKENHKIPKTKIPKNAVYLTIQSV